MNALPNFEMADRSSFTSHVDFVVGVDLGQANDFTALTVIDRIIDVIDDVEKPARYEIRHLQRLKLGTSYPDCVSIVGRLLTSLPARINPPTLIVDATGVGRPVVDLMRKAGLRPVAVSITGGANENSAGNFNYAIPKRNLISALQIVFQSRRLKVARSLAEGPTLVNELMNFKVKISLAGHDSYEAWRESIHDDLVLSASLAVWWAERNKKPPYMIDMNFYHR